MTASIFYDPGRHMSHNPKSEFVNALDVIQKGVSPLLKRHGFSVRGRTFNRTTPERLTHVIKFQMGSYDPPGTTYIPGLRENLYGKFAVNLGVYVPEVARDHGGGEAKSIVQEYHCCIRARLGNLGPERSDIWWSIEQGQSLISDISFRLEVEALSFLGRFQNREDVLTELATDKWSAFVAVPRIVKAVILVGLSRNSEAETLLAAQVNETRNPGHPAYVRRLAEKLGLHLPAGQ